MSLDEGVEMLSARMGNLQCQENDKKDVSSETIDKIKEDVVSKVRIHLTRTTPS